MVWGSFSYKGLGELVIMPKNETLNKEKYLQLLKNNLRNSFKKCKIATKKPIFMQDGATPHTAKIVKDYFRINNIKYIEDWPGNSPDLNPIENLWAHIKVELGNRDTSTLRKLQWNTRDIWNNFNLKTLHNLVNSIPGRMAEVIARKGNPIGY